MRRKRFAGPFALLPALPLCVVAEGKEETPLASGIQFPFRAKRGKGMVLSKGL